MTWVLIGLLATLCLAPLAAALRRGVAPRGRREAELALYREQAAELARERAAGRLDAGAHRDALREVQRRALAVPEADPGDAVPPPVPPALWGVLALVPAAALGLYLWHGLPGVPSAPLSARREASAREEDLLATLRARLATLDPAGEAARQGWVLLGNAERSRGRPDAVAEAWGRALAARFDAALAGELAEVELDRGGTDAAAALLARALAAAPADPRLRFLAGLAEARAGRPEGARVAWRALLGEAPEGAPWRAVVERALAGLP